MKRLFDLLISALGLLVLALPLLTLAWLVRRKLGSPVLFAQVRPGLHGKPFRMVKFRTMTNVCDASGALLPDAQRLASFGRFLRASSLDELPELWNVLRGEMSLVGPRPEVPRYVACYPADVRDVVRAYRMLAVSGEPGEIYEEIRRRGYHVSLGEREAHHLGFDLLRTRRIMIASIALLVGPLVAVTGGVAFVGLVVPHLLRLRVGADHRLLLPLSALVGATVLVLADWLSRVVVLPAELPVGVVTSLVGGPYFLWLLARTPREQASQPRRTAA